MKLNEKAVSAIKAAMQEFGIVDTDSNRQEMAMWLICSGFATLAMHKGMFQSLAKEFDIDPLQDHEEPATPQSVDGCCSNCGFKPVLGQDGKKRCNCFVWPSEKE